MTTPKVNKKNIEIPKEVIKESLESKRVRDGNIAFKVTYVDSGWNGVCSPNIADFNFKNRTWCKIQSTHPINCQSDEYSTLEKIKTNGEPCADCVARTYLSFYAGHYHGSKKNNEPIRCLNAKLGKIGIFTSREPGTKENERFIFAIGEIYEIETVQENNGIPFEEYYLNPELTLEFSERVAPKFWKYYNNPNNPQRIAWNTGLFRYLNDKTVRKILDDISIQFKNKLTIPQKNALIKLLEKVS